MSRAGTAKKHSFLGSIFRFACGLFNVALALLLPCQLAFLYFLWNGAKIELPEEVREQIAGKLADIGIKANFQKIILNASGRVEIDNLAFSQPGHADKIFTARRAVIDFSPLDLVLGKIDPRRIFVDAATLFCPASTSPTGRREIVIDDMRASVAKEGEWLTVETLQAKFGEMPVVAFGNLIQPTLAKNKTPDAGDTAKTVRDTWKNISQNAAKILRVRDELQTVGAVSLEIEGRGDSAGAVALAVTARGKKFDLPGGVVAHNAELTFSIRFDGAEFHPGKDSRLTVGTAEWTNADTGLAVKTGRLRFATRFGGNWERPTNGWFSACNVEINGNRIDYARGTANWEKFPNISAGVYVVKDDDFIFADAAGDWKTQALQLAFRTRLTPEKYLTDERIKKNLPDELNALVFPSRPEIAGTVNFAPGFKFTETDFSLNTGDVQFGQFKMKSVEADIRLTPEKLEVRNADLRADGYRAQGDFSTGFADDAEYRFLLRGNTFPYLLNGLIGDWWPKLWADFRLDHHNLPQVDIEVHGQWEGRPDEFIYCAAVGSDVAYRGERVDTVELRIVELPTLFALFDMHAAQNGLGAAGTLQWHYVLGPTYRRHSLRFQFDGILPKKTAVTFAGEGLPEALEPITLKEPPAIGVTGFYHLAASPQNGREQVVVNVTAPGEITAWNLPFKNFAGTVAYDSRQLAITINNAEFGGGKIVSALDAALSAKEKTKTKTVPHRMQPSRAWVDLRPDAPVLKFDAEIINARRHLFFEALGELGNTDAAPEKPVAPTPPPVTSPATDNSELDIRFAGTIILPKLETLCGTGDAYVYDPDIPQLHVFGGLSRVLDKMGLGLASFKLERAQSNFTIQKGKVYFPHLKITGPDSEINASGYYVLENKTLNMRAILTSKIGNEIPVIGHVIDVFNRLPRLVPVDVTGTLEEPEWSLDPTPSALFHSSFNEELGTPPEEEISPDKKNSNSR